MRAGGIACLAALAVASSAACWSLTADVDISGGGGDQGSASDAASNDATIDAAIQCRAEPEWATADGGVPDTATCDGTPGVSLLLSGDHCGRCDHGCGGESCQGGLCAQKTEATLAGGCEVILFGAVGDEVFYTGCSSFLGALGPRGARPVADLSGMRADSGEELSAEGVFGSATELFFAAGGHLFHVNAEGVAQELANNLPGLGYDSMFAGTESILAYTTRAELVVLDKKGEVGKRFPSPASHHIASSRSAIYWMEEPWNALAGGSDQTSPKTRILKTTGTDVAIVRDEAARLTGLVVADDGIYYARLGKPDGGIYRLPADATLASEPKLIAADDGLTARTVIAVDATHVYWLRPHDNTDDAEIVKRAKCGGATVTLIAPLPQAALYSTSLATLGDRVYFHDGPYVRSVAK
jgi:hypothetical protein